MKKDVIVLADIGGTHARFARFQGGRMEGAQKLRAGDYPSFLACLEAYGGAPGSLYVAAAGNRLRKPNQYNHWIVEREPLEQAGWRVAPFVNDFRASAQGIVALDAAGLTVLRPGLPAPDQPRALLGPGTGLGLAYIMPAAQGSHVQETYGGHMLAASYTAEQADILGIIAGLKQNDKAVVYENVASGSGLSYLYRAVCQQQGVKSACESAEEILATEDDASRIALRLFHEFLGLFAHHALITGHAFGGLYLDGGMLQRLQDAKRWDAAAFLGAFDRPLLPVVRESAAHTPVYLVKDPFIALRGLAEMIGHVG